MEILMEYHQLCLALVEITLFQDQVIFNKLFFVIKLFLSQNTLSYQLIIPCVYGKKILENY
jgi:hypothetical protein